MKNWIVSIGVFALMLPFLVIAQTRESGPWWPNPDWGPEDPGGGLELDYACQGDGGDAVG